MKKLFLLCMMCLLALTIKAQRCAVLDFQVGNNITEEEVDGVTYAFRSNFRPTNYTILERMMINQVVSNFGYTRTDMTRQQMLRVGRELETAIIVIGTVNKFMDEYSVDIQVVNVSTGTTTATEGATFQKTEYRNAVQNIANSLVKKLGSQNAAGNSGYKEVAAGYTDLGLPSGTIWKNFNATGFYTYDEAVSQFGNRLPTKEQWEELKAECQWTWTGSGYKVTGPNGNSITLPAEGYRVCAGIVYDVGSCGVYWSSTPNGSGDAWHLQFHSGGVCLIYEYRCIGISVRLVQD